MCLHRRCRSGNARGLGPTLQPDSKLLDRQARRLLCSLERWAHVFACLHVAGHDMRKQPSPRHFCRGCVHAVILAWGQSVFWFCCGMQLFLFFRATGCRNASLAYRRGTTQPALLLPLPGGLQLLEVASELGVVCWSWSCFGHVLAKCFAGRGLLRAGKT